MFPVKEYRNNHFIFYINSSLIIDQDFLWDPFIFFFSCEAMLIFMTNLVHLNIKKCDITQPFLNVKTIWRMEIMEF